MLLEGDDGVVVDRREPTLLALEPDPEMSDGLEMEPSHQGVVASHHQSLLVLSDERPKRS